MTSIRRRTGLLLAAASVFCAAAAEAADPAADILQLAPMTNGFCLQLNPSSPAMPGNLAGSGRFIVHGISANRETVATLRTALLVDGLSGMATVQCDPLKTIPCVDNLFNLLVAEDIVALMKDGLPAAELVRVLAPGGAVCLGAAPDQVGATEAALTQAGLTGVRPAKLSRTWITAVKPRPAGMDDWPQPNHGLDGNPVSQDRFIGPPNTIRWCTGPVVPTTRTGIGPAYSGVARMISLGGRNFYLLGNNLLVARDGFNGHLLWTRPAGQANSVHTRLVAAGDQICVSGDKEIHVLDPATGRLARSMRGDPWVMLGFTNRLVTVDQGAIRCFDLSDGQQKWATTNRWNRPDGCPPVAADGRLYVLREVALGATELETGTHLWSVDVTNTIGAGARMAFVHGDILMLRRTLGSTNQFFALSSRTGAPLWQLDAVKTKPSSYPGDQPFLVNGHIWINDWDEKGQMIWKALDPATGAVRRTLPASTGGTGCHPVFVTDRYAIGRRPCDFMSWEDGKLFPNKAARGACGRVPIGLANGQFYLQQCNVPFGCVCGPFFVGLSGWGCDNIPPAPATDERWIHGEVKTSTTSAAGAAPAAWPVFRHDTRRSSCTSNAVPATLAIRWTRKLEPGRWPETILRDDWLLRLPSPHLLTGPTLADGKVFLSLTEAGAAIALDETDGRVLWTFPTGGRLDTPPTFADGLALVGSHDGHVYALDAASGRLAWDFRAAPTPRRMAAFGQVESSSPVIGGVLPGSNRVFVVSGRNTEVEDGVYVHGIDHRSGSLAWTAHRPLPPEVKVAGWNIFKGMADLLTADEISITIAGSARGRFDPETGGVPKEHGLPKFNVPVATAFHYVSRNLYGRGPGEYPPCPVAFNDTFNCRPVIRFEDQKTRLRQAGLLAMPNGARKETPKLWEVFFPAGSVVESVVLAADTVLVALSLPPVTTPATTPGTPPAGQAETEKRGGELALLKAADGTTIASVALPAAPVYEGLAVAPGRVYACLEDGTVICLAAPPGATP